MGIETELYGDDIQEFPHIYRGVVEDNNDPVKAGRIRIRILGIHSDNLKYVPTDTLPWAIPATSIGLDGGGLRNIGQYKVPDIGSHLFVFFEGGDHNFPVYFAGAPAIEQIDDYQEKDGKLKDSKYEYDEKKQYDDKTNYSDRVDWFETPEDDKIVPEKQVLDFPPQTRKDTFDEGDPATSMDPPGCTGEGAKKKPITDPQAIFPREFFQKDIRVAFDGKANHDTEGYDGIYQSKPSNELTELEKKQELNKWDERKWGYNDNDNEHQHDWGGGPEWKPEYPMCSTTRNTQGEIIDTDILKERRTYIHPSKYFIEYIQLDSSRKKDDFQNEKSIKNIYERQRGEGNSPDRDSSPRVVKSDADGQEFGSNNPNPLVTDDDQWDGRKNNTLTYDDIDGETREQDHTRFEERKHNPGREKTVVEDFVYRYYLNKVNETYKVDRNTRIYTGNDNLEIEHGDVNERLHRGSHNMHLDEGNFNRTVNKGWYHLHIDKGHHFVELNGSNPFETSGSHEPKGNPYNCINQHKTTLVPNGADNEGCDAKFAAWPFAEGENECANQFFLLHDGHQIFRLEKGHQHFQLNKGHQKFWLINGHQTFHLMLGDQRFQLDNGNMERWVNGKRVSYYAQHCHEESVVYWKFKSPKIVLEGDVLITGQLEVYNGAKIGVGVDSPGISGGAAHAPEGSGFYLTLPSISNVSDSITPGVCSSHTEPVVR